MNKNLRILILIVVLAVPSLIFIFLHQFGQNEFDVPVQHAEGLNFDGCPEKSKVPFEVPVIDTLGIEKGEYKVVFIEQDTLTKAQLNDLRRVTQNHPGIDFIFLYHSPLEIKIKEYKQQNWNLFNLKKNKLKELNRCGFGNIDNHSLVLIDPEQHVRGYYELTKKELDRLEGELKILTE